MKIRNIFSVIAIAAACTVSNPVNAQENLSSYLEDKGYDQLATLKQTSKLGNSYNEYLKRTDPETGEEERWLLSTKPETGLAVSAGAKFHNYHGFGAFMPMVGLSWIGSYFIVDGEVAYGQTQYMDPASNLYGQKYNMVVATGDILWKCIRSAGNNQYLEKWYIAIGPYIEYDNRRNSSEEQIENEKEYTVNTSKVQGSSYAFGGKGEIGLNFPKIGGSLAVGGYIGTGRDYEGTGTVNCGTWGIYAKGRILLFSKTTYSKLGLVKKNNPEKFKSILKAYDNN